MNINRKILLSLLALSLVAITAISVSLKPDTDFLKGGLFPRNHPVGSGTIDTPPFTFEVLNPQNGTNFNTSSDEGVQVSVAVDGGDIESIICLAKVGERTDINEDVIPFSNYQLDNTYQSYEFGVPDPVTHYGTVFSGFIPMSDLETSSSIYFNCRGSEVSDTRVDYTLTAGGSYELPRVTSFHPNSTTGSSTRITVHTDREVDVCKYSTTDSSIYWNDAGLEELTPNSSGTMHTGVVTTTGERTYVTVICGSDLSVGYEASEYEQFAITRAARETTITMPTIIRKWEQPILADQPGDTEDLPVLMDVANPVVIYITNNFETERMEVELAHAGTSALRAYYDEDLSAPGRAPVFRIEWDGQTCGQYTTDKTKTNTMRCPDGGYTIRVTSTYKGSDGTDQTYQETGDFNLSSEAGPTSFEPSVTFSIPDTLNQNEITKYSGAIGDAEPIPYDMVGSPSFRYSKNFDSITDFAIIRQGGTVKATFALTPDLGAGESSLSRDMTIKWDGQTCGNYNVEPRKLSNAECEPGIYEFYLLSSFIDPDTSSPRQISKTQTFRITADGGSGSESIEFNIPDEINQSLITKWGSPIGDSEPIPDEMTGRSRFNYSKNFVAVQENVTISKDGRILVAHQYSTAESAPTERDIFWDGQTCGSYELVGQLYNKIRTFDCPTGIYEFKVRSAIRDSYVDPIRYIEKTKTFRIINSTTPGGSAPVVTIDSPRNGATITPNVETDGTLTTVLLATTDKPAVCFASETSNFKSLAEMNPQFTSTTYHHRLDVVVDSGTNTWYVKCTDDLAATVNSTYSDVVHSGNMSSTVSTTFRTEQTSNNTVSCDLNYIISNTQNDKFDPDTEKITFNYKLNGESSLNGKLRLIGPIEPMSDDILNNTDVDMLLANISLETDSLPHTNSLEWKGKGPDNSILEDGIYLAILEADEIGSTNDDHDCEDIRPITIEHTGGTGNLPVMQLSAKKQLVPVGEDQIVVFRNNVEATKVVINLYRTDQAKPVSTAYYYCGPGESCPSTNSTNLNVNTRSIVVPYQYFATPAKYYFKASLKTKSGKIYKVSSNRFEPESDTVLIPQCNFADVNPADPRFSDIIRVCEMGVMMGSADQFNPSLRTFKPYQVMNRIEGITISNRLSLCPDYRATPADGDLGFIDMQQYLGNLQANWMFDEIKKGISCLRLTGYADGTIRPANGLNNAESWKIVLEAIQNSGLARFNPIYADNRKDPWWSDYEFFLRQNGFNLPNPTLEVTRAEVASLIVELERRGLVEFLQPLR